MIPETCELLDRPLGLDADRLADLEVLLGGRLLVDHDLVRPRPRALDERERVEGRVGVRDREAEVRRAAEDDRLAVVADELGRVGVDAALGLARPRAAPAPSASRDSSKVGSVTPLPSLRSKADLPVMTAFEPCADVREDLVERLVDRVRQDVGAADHRDAEHDRERRQRRPQLPAQQARGWRSAPSLVRDRLERVELRRAARGHDRRQDPDDDRDDRQHEELHPRDRRSECRTPRARG